MKIYSLDNIPNTTTLNRLVLPTRFRGVSWDECQWEFDCPCVVYMPFQRYEISSSIGGVSNIVDAFCDDLLFPPRRYGEFLRWGWSDAELFEFGWRGWSADNMKRRKNAWHIEINVTWFLDAEGEMCCDYSTTEQEKPFADTDYDRTAIIYAVEETRRRWKKRIKEK